MALVIPNIEDAPAFDAQVITDATDLAAWLAVANSTGTTSGDGTVSAETSPDMTVKTAAWAGLIDGTAVNADAVDSLAITDPSSTDRRDIVVVSSEGTVSTVEGAPCSVAGWTVASDAYPPVKPAIPSGSALLGEVYVQAGATTITADNIIDKSGRCLASGQTPVLFGIGNQAPGAALASFVNQGLADATPLVSLFDIAPLYSFQCLVSLGGGVVLAGTFPLGIAEVNFGHTVNLVYRSTDDGKTWTGIATPWDGGFGVFGPLVTALAVGDDGEVFLVGSTGLGGGSTFIAGHSTDGGLTWEDVSGDLPIPSAPAIPATVLADAPPPVLPLTIIEGVNDSFVYPSSGGGSIFVIAPGTYSTVDDLVIGMGAAEGGELGTFGGAVTPSNQGGTLLLTSANPGSSSNGQTITDYNGAAAALGFGTVATVTADSPPSSVPLTIIEGVNDTFGLNVAISGSANFGIAPGTYNTLDDITSAVQAAVNGENTVADYLTVTNDGTRLVFTTLPVSLPSIFTGTVLTGAAGNASSMYDNNGGGIAIGIAHGPDTFAGGLGNPDTFSGGVDGGTGPYGVNVPSCAYDGTYWYFLSDTPVDGVQLWRATSPSGPWTPIVPGLTSGAYSIVVATPSVVMVLIPSTIYNTLGRSTDHGATWGTINVTNDAQMTSLATDGDGNWMAWSFTGGWVAQSLDDGATWATGEGDQAAVFPPSFVTLAAVCFLEGTGWVIVWGRNNAGGFIVYTAPVEEPLVITPTGYVTDNMYCPIALVPVST